jgi:hypothetical protein
MKTAHLAACCLGALALLVGCEAIPTEYGLRSMKPNINAGTLTRYSPASYVVLGPVEAQGESSTILGVVTNGSEGQGLLWKRAKERYGDSVTGIKDVTASYEYSSVLLPVWGKITTTYYGVAVREAGAGAATLPGTMPMPSPLPGPLAPR